MSSVSQKLGRLITSTTKRFFLTSSHYIVGIRNHVEGVFSLQWTIFYQVSLLPAWKSCLSNSASQVLKSVLIAQCIFLQIQMWLISNTWLLTLAANEKFLILVGDFNLPDICWSSLSGCSLPSNLFCDFVFESNLAQLITCPTHIRGNILDILLTNCDHLISRISVTKPSDSSLPSDHYLISFLIECNQE